MDPVGVVIVLVGLILMWLVALTVADGQAGGDITALSRAVARLDGRVLELDGRLAVEEDLSACDDDLDALHLSTDRRLLALEGKAHTHAPYTHPKFCTFAAVGEPCGREPGSCPVCHRDEPAT